VETHTPELGPLRVERSVGDWGFPVTFTLYEGDSPEPLIWLRGGAMSCFHNPREAALTAKARAYANLFAAAPKLLAACKKALANCVVCPPDPAARILLAAIADAEGGEK
jgi:hypothetical protein